MNKLYSFEVFKDIDKIGFFFFLAGVFLLASAVGVAILFLLISLFISLKKPSQFFKDKWNYPLLASTIWMFFSILVHFFLKNHNYEISLDPKLSLLGIINWIPFFLAFWGFQKYLDTPQKRLVTAKVLISGSVPVIFSGILQLLNINGPFQLLNGLIVWFQKPLEEIGSISGLFNNQNYAGLWMVLVWPFCLAELKKNKVRIINKVLAYIIALLFVIFIFLTDSRNAILGLIISSPIVLGTGSLIWYLPSVFLGLTFLAITVIPIFPSELQLFMKSIIPSRFYTLFPEIGFSNLSAYPRINKWLAASNYITKQPLFGWGAAAFPVLYFLEKGEWFGHAHNLPLELAISYGLIPALLFSLFYLTLLYCLLKKISKESKFKVKNFEFFLNQKAWFAASLIFFLSHLVDIQYFDVRISTICWILLAGMRSSLKEKI